MTESYSAVFAAKHLASLMTAKPFRLLFATDKDGVIGNGLVLPWRCKPDIDRFKDLTLGNTVVIGIKTYIGLLKSKPSHVLKGSDVIIVYGVTSTDDDSIERERLWVLSLPKVYKKTIGERLLALPAPRELMQCHDVDQRAVFDLQDAIQEDIQKFITPGQQVFVAGGAALNEMLYDMCGTAEITIIHHKNSINERIYLGPKCCNLLQSLPFNHKNSEQHGRDKTWNTSCSHYSVSLINPL